jgi:TolA-binding protein
MRGFIGWAAALLFVVAPAMARAKGGAGDTPAPATDSAPTAAKAPAKASPEASDTAKTDASNLEVEIEELRDLLQNQAKQLQSQSDQLNEQQKRMQVLEDQVKGTSTARENLLAAPAGASAAVAGTSGPISASSTAVLTSLPAASVPTATATAASDPVGAAGTPTPQDQGVPDSPLQFHLGSAYFTPVGFMDFTAVFRNHNAQGGIGSNFASLPYALTSAAGAQNPLDHVTEGRLSIQNSRIGFRVDAPVKGAHVIGYMEADFLGNNPTNVSVTSNSNTLRSRLYWVDITKNKWEILGGQSWSLITPNRVGISPLPGNVFFTQDMDVNYQVGLAWGRIPELRFVYHPTDKAAFAIALDNQDQYAGGSSGAPTIVLPTGSTINGGVSTLVSSFQLDAGAGTQNSPAVFPDVILKAAFDPSPRYHFEVGGVERQFRVAVNSTTATTSPIIDHSLTGGGVFGNFNVQLFNGFRVIVNAFWSQGGGRYIFGTVPDVIVQPNGSLSAIKASSTVSGFEYRFKNTLLYSYYGGVYAGKDVGFLNGTEYGYGVDAVSSGNYASAISQNRTIQEATIGFNQTMWADPKYGALNVIGQYSWLTRNPWGVVPGQPNEANLNLVFLDLRYTLPGSAPTLGK